jgi:hypothetical protein
MKLDNDKPNMNLSANHEKITPRRKIIVVTLDSVSMLFSNIVDTTVLSSNISE